MVEHLKDENEKSDTHVYDAATAEQEKEQRSSGLYDHTEGTHENDVEDMEEDWDVPCQDSSCVDEMKV